MTDSNPEAAEAKPSEPNGKELSQSNKRVLKGLDASWNMFGESPDTGAAKKENVPLAQRQERGDGMGGRKGVTRDWGFGDDSDGESHVRSKPLPSRKQQQPSGNEERSWWDF